MKKIFAVLAALSFVFASCLDTSGPYDVGSESVSGTQGSSGGSVNPNLPGVFEVPGSSTALSDGVWYDDTITAGDLWYRFPVTDGVDYYIWWNARTPNGDGSKGAQVSVSAYYEGGTPIFTDQTNGWDTNRGTFNAAGNGTVYVKVHYTSAGNFAICYAENTSTAGDPDWPPTVDPTRELDDTNGKEDWVDSTLAAAYELQWWSFEIKEDEVYYIWSRDSDWSGNLVGTAVDISIRIYREDGTLVTSGVRTADDNIPNMTNIDIGVNSTRFVKLDANAIMGIAGGNATDTETIYIVAGNLSFGSSTGNYSLQWTDQNEGAYNARTE